MKKTIIILSIMLTWNTTLIANGQALYKTCKCHGDNGKTKALHLSKAIAGQASATTIRQLNAYKKGQLNKYGLGNIMKMQAATLSASDIKSLASYIETLK
jgi:cytochrome c553